ncbi:MAG: alternative ribosome rescue aminoacyl-tRNA hydrolase ArfB [Anaerolineae bacterium]
MIHISETVSIPLSELSFRFSRSSGPGGQHVNKAETRVELLFDVANSPSLTDAQREQVMRRLSNRIDSAGVLRVTSQATRSQKQNRELAIERFRRLMEKALQPVKKRKATRLSRAAKERRLREKRRRSETKKYRRGPRPDEW